MSRYSAAATHPSLDEAGLPGELTVGQWTLKFAAGEVAVEFPFARLEIELEDSPEERVVFQHPEFPDWTLCVHP